MRAFVAWNPAPAELDALESLQAELRRERDAPGYRWIPREQLHLTLRFLGEVDPERQAKLEPALAALALREAPFAAQVAGWQYLPGRHAPRVLVLRIESRGAMERLAAGVESVVREAGFARERRPFLAHLTLARTAFLERLPEPFLAPPPPIGLAIDHVALVRSDLASQDARYRTVARFALARA